MEKSALLRPGGGAPARGGRGILVVGVFDMGCPLSDEGVFLTEEEEECLEKRLSEDEW